MKKQHSEEVTFKLSPTAKRIIARIQKAQAMTPSHIREKILAEGGRLLKRALRRSRGIKKH